MSHRQMKAFPVGMLGCMSWLFEVVFDVSLPQEVVYKLDIVPLCCTSVRLEWHEPLRFGASLYTRPSHELLLDFYSQI